MPGRSVPGKSVPGKSVPGKSVPGKQRKRRKGNDEEEDEADTRHLDTTAMTHLGTLAKPDLLEVLRVCGNIQWVEPAGPAGVDVVRRSNPCRNLEGLLEEEVGRPTLTAFYRHITWVFKEVIQDRHKVFRRQKEVFEMTALVVVYGWLKEENVLDVLPLIQPIPTDHTVQVDKLRWKNVRPDETVYKMFGKQLMGKDVCDLRLEPELNDQVSNYIL